MLEARQGLVFRYGGQEYEVVEASSEGARCSFAGGWATTLTRYGTEVTHAGETAVLAHPAAGTAWERLRAWRSERAKALGVPAFVVFDDSTLRLVAAHLPATESGLLSLRGIGPAKLESYGSELMGIVEEVLASTARD